MITSLHVNEYNSVGNSANRICSRYILRLRFITNKLLKTEAYLSTYLHVTCDVILSVFTGGGRGVLSLQSCF